MNNNYDILLEKLKNLAEMVSKQNLNTTFAEKYGSVAPYLTKVDVAAMIYDFISNLEKIDSTSLSSYWSQELGFAVSKIEYYLQNIITIFKNQQPYAILSFITTIQSIRLVLNPLFEKKITEEVDLEILEKIINLQNDFNNLVVSRDQLVKDLKIISKGKELALEIPITLKLLNDAKVEVTNTEVEVKVSNSKITENLEAVTRMLKSITDSKDKADKTLANIEDTYRITTTKGLAASFEQRAKSLNQTMVVWIIGLVLALSAGAYIGYLRFESFTEAIKDPKLTIGILFMEFILCLLSFGGPIWFAWIATKQTGQRFKLAEDYAFKASVAKAYEGYKKEASRLDIKLETRLFDSALTRLEEAPIRFMDSEMHGSPWHEMLSSKEFLKTLENVPDLKAKLFELANNAINKAKIES